MVSQSQEEWESGSRAGSMLSLDGRPRPTPPSYYDAVRSRHSLSQPATTKSPSEQPDKLQQVKYNSLPRPLPQRYPPANGRWPEEYYAPRGDAPVRQQYDAPPKPANRVPLQLLPPKRPSYPGDPRVPDPRGNGTLANRKEGLLRPDPRQPPPGTTRRPPQQRPPNDTNSLPRRDSNGLLRRCYPILPNGSTPPHAYPPSAAPPHSSPYEPRYSKSGKLLPRSAPTQEPRPMPPPVVMLRTGPLGTYPDAETLKMYQPSPQDMSQQIYVDTNSYSNGQQPVVADHLAIPYRIPQVSPPKMQQQPHQKECPELKSRTLPRSDARRPPDPNYYEGRSVPCRRSSGSTSNLDKDGDAIYANQQFYGQMPNGQKQYDQQRGKSPLSNGLQKSYNGDYPDQQQQRGQLNNGHQKLHNDYPDQQQQRGQLNNGHQKMHSDYPDQQQQRGQLHNGHPKAHNDYQDQHRGQLNIGHQKMHNGYADQQRGQSNAQPKMHNGSSDYPDQQRGQQLNNGHPKTYAGSKDQQRPASSSNAGPPKGYNEQLDGPLYENSQQISSRSDSENLYANHHVYNNNGHFDPKVPTPKTTRSDRRNTHPPPVAQKPPQPTEMVMVTERPDWSVSQSTSAYPKDLVKPTPRMPRLPNGILTTSSSQSVPAYQFVLNELSSHPLHHVSPPATSSSTLSLRSGYDSSSSSSREFGRRPTKSDSSADLARSSENHLKPNGGHQQIDKSLLSVSMTSLCSDASSLISLRPRKHREESWDRMSEETQKRKDKGSKFSASPWEREEKEKQQHEQVLDARRLRDQEIAHLESLEERSEKQSNLLRILCLEREFQRRAEEDSCTSSSSSSDTEDDDTDKVESFHRDKLTVIPNERMGLQLLDELLEPPSKTSPPANPSPSTSPEKHFLPLDVSIPEPPSHGLPVTNNILKISEEQRKPPVPAPRPSKRAEDLSSLSKLDISDPCAYFCSGEEGGEDHLPRDWTIEVTASNFEDESRIYENVIKPADYHCIRTNGSHTLPKAVAANPTAAAAARRQPKFPVMGVSSTLTKKANGGYVPSDVDILPSLYASCKTGGGYTVAPVPTDLVNKSPEFKKMWVQRPEKLTFQDKIRKFSLQAGEEDAPRDRVKNSRAQREIEIKFSDAQKRAAAAQRAAEA